MALLNSSATNTGTCFFCGSNSFSSPNQPSSLSRMYNTKFPFCGGSPLVLGLKGLLERNPIQTCCVIREKGQQKVSLRSFWERSIVLQSRGLFLSNVQAANVTRCSNQPSAIFQMPFPPWNHIWHQSCVKMFPAQKKESAKYYHLAFSFCEQEFAQFSFQQITRLCLMITFIHNRCLSSLPFCFCFFTFHEANFKIDETELKPEPFTVCSRNYAGLSNKLAISIHQSIIARLQWQNVQSQGYIHPRPTEWHHGIWRLLRHLQIKFHAASVSSVWIKPTKVCVAWLA